MSTKIKGKTFAAKVGSSAKSKSASLPTRLDSGGAGNTVKGQDERQKRAPLTAFPAPYPRTPFFRLTAAVVVIDRMTELKKQLAISNWQFSQTAARKGRPFLFGSVFWPG
jgi:hypothetical protein